MIAVSEAKEFIYKHCGQTRTVLISLSEAAGLVLSEDVLAPISLPPFNQSGMDGYAFRLEDYDPVKGLNITQVVQAGEAGTIELKPGEAARIFTGAALPDLADTVVMQEQATIKSGCLFLAIETRVGTHVRLTGSEINKDALAMQKGSYLSPSAIGYLAGMGITEVPVYSKPLISILITGNELQEPGTALRPGQVYESSSIALKAALRNLPVDLISCVPVRDEPELVLEALKEALQRSDIVLLTGGVSVGDFDFVSAAAEKAGVKKIFHRIKQKPGKPLYFGMYGERPVFGLPGNPSSVLTCFYQYVLPAIEQLSGRMPVERTTIAQIGASYQKNKGITHFLKGRYDNGTAYPLNAQESFRLSSFAHANCLIVAEEDRETYSEGDPIEIFILPD